MKRRDLLGAAASAPLLGSAGAAATPAEAFAEAAIALAGSGAMPAFVMETAQRMLVREFSADLVAELVGAIGTWRPGAALPDRVEPLARRLLVILYTGETDAADPRARVGHYPWALAWRVLDFTKVPGLCSGSFGDWARR